MTGAHIPSVPINVKELLQAGNRIVHKAADYGGNEPAAVAWLLAFLESDPFTLSPTEVEVRWWECLRFAADAGQGGTDYGQSGRLPFEAPTTCEGKLVLLSELRDGLTEVLRKYLTVGVASFPKGEVSITISRGYPRVLFSGTNITGGFFFMAGQLLARFGHRITRCDGCAVIMLRGRKDKRFHSKNCQMTHFMRSRRAQEKADRLHKERARTLRASTHSKKKGKRTGGKRHGTKR